MKIEDKLTRLLAAAKTSLKAANVTKVWFETDGGWESSHTISIETSDEKPVDTVILNGYGAGNTVQITKLSEAAKSAVKNAFSSVEKELFENRISFYYGSSDGKNYPSNVLIYPPASIITQKHRKISQLQFQINKIYEEIAELETL